MGNLQARFEAVKKQLDEQQTLKIKIETNLENMKESINTSKGELLEFGIEYDSLEELQAIAQEREGRLERLLSNLEGQLG